MLGVLQLLYIVDKMPNTLRAILKHSQIQKYEYPLAIKMFSFSSLCISFLRNGKLYYWCSTEQSVIDVFNQAYRGLFLKFAFLYITESHDIKTINELGNRVGDEARGGIKSSINEFLELDDKEGVALIQDATQLAQQNRIEKLKKESELFTVKEDRK